MSGYVTSARIVGATPRLARGERRAIPADEPTRRLSGGVVEIEAIPGPDRPPNRNAERWDAARERWSQLTFFLFDPNSWRT